MAELAKGSRPELNALRTGPVTSFSDAFGLISGDQFHLISQSNGDQPSDLISSRDPDLALNDLKTLMPLFGERAGYENAEELWDSDRRRPKK